MVKNPGNRSGKPAMIGVTLNAFSAAEGSHRPPFLLHQQKVFKTTDLRTEQPPITDVKNHRISVIRTWATRIKDKSIASIEKTAKKGIQRKDSPVSLAVCDDHLNGVAIRIDSIWWCVANFKWFCTPILGSNTKAVTYFTKE